MKFFIKDWINWLIDGPHTIRGLLEQIKFWDGPITKNLLDIAYSTCYGFAVTGCDWGWQYGLFDSLSRILTWR